MAKKRLPGNGNFGSFNMGTILEFLLADSEAYPIPEPITSVKNLVAFNPVPECDEQYISKIRNGYGNVSKNRSEHMVDSILACIKAHINDVALAPGTRLSDMHTLQWFLNKLLYLLKEETDNEVLAQLYEQLEHCIKKDICIRNNKEYRLLFGILGEIFKQACLHNNIKPQKGKKEKSKPAADDSGNNYIYKANANYVLKSTSVHPRPIFISDARKNIFDEIDKHFDNGTHAIILRGMGGIGKSEIAKQYARMHGKTGDSKYDTIVFAQLNMNKDNNLKSLISNDGIFIIPDFPKRGEYILEDNRIEDEYEYFRRKLNKIKEISDSHTLIIIDNFDVSQDKYLLEFLEGSYNILITTRYLFAGLDCPTIEVGELDTDSLKKLFFKNSGRRDISYDDPDFENLFKIFAGHTMTIEIIAKIMAENTLTLSEMIKAFKEKSAVFNIDDKVQLSVAEDEKTLYEYIRNIFKFSLSDINTHHSECIAVLTNMALMPLSGVLERDFIKWCGLKNLSAIKILIRRNLIRSDIRDGGTYLSMHPVIREVVMVEFKPEITVCGCLINGFTKQIEYNGIYFKNHMERSYLSNIAEQLLEYFSDVNDDTVDLFLTCDYLFHGCGNFEKSYWVLEKLHNFYLKKYGEDSYEMGCIYLRISSFYYAIESGWNRAEDWIIKANRVFKQYDSSSTYATVEMGKFYISMSQYNCWKYKNYNKPKFIDEAVVNAEKSIEVLKNVIKKDDQLIYILGESYVSLADVLILQGNSKMYPYIKKILKKAEETFSLSASDSSTANGSTIYRYAQMAFINGNFNEAIEFAQNSIDIYISLFGMYNPYLIKRYELLGDCYFKINSSKAFDAYTVMYEISIRIFKGGNETVERAKAKMQAAKSMIR